MASHLAVDFRRRAGIADSAARRTGIALERAAWSNAMLLLPSPLSSPSYASRCLDQGRTRRVIVLFLWHVGGGCLWLSLDGGGKTDRPCRCNILKDRTDTNNNLVRPRGLVSTYPRAPHVVQ